MISIHGYKTLRVNIGSHFFIDYDLGPLKQQGVEACWTLVEGCDQGEDALVAKRGKLFLASLKYRPCEVWTRGRGGWSQSGGSNGFVWGRVVSSGDPPVP